MYFINYYLLPLYDYCYCYDLYSVLYVLPRILNVYFNIYCDLHDKWRHINCRSSCDDDIYSFFADFEMSINYTISVVFQYVLFKCMVLKCNHQTFTYIRVSLIVFYTPFDHRKVLQTDDDECKTFLNRFCSV